MRLIDADVLIKSTDKEIVHKWEIALAPTVDPVKHGRWRHDKPLGLEWCSECGFGKRNGDKRWYSYCPSCGAKMEVEDETD